MEEIRKSTLPAEIKGAHPLQVIRWIEDRIIAQLSLLSTSVAMALSAADRRRRDAPEVEQRDAIQVDNNEIRWWDRQFEAEPQLQGIEPSSEVRHSSGSSWVPRQSKHGYAKQIGTALRQSPFLRVRSTGTVPPNSNCDSSTKAHKELLYMI